MSPYDLRNVEVLRSMRERVSAELEAIDFALLAIGTRDQRSPPGDQGEVPPNKDLSPCLGKNADIRSPPVAPALNAESEQPDPQGVVMTTTPAPTAELGTPHPTVGWAKKTPERVALLASLWGDTRNSRPHILERLNALPGGHINLASLSSFVVLWNIAKSAREELRSPPPIVPRHVPAPVKAVAETIAKANGEPVRATAETINQWASQRGIEAGAKNLDQTNATRRRLGLAAFEVEPSRIPR